MHAQEVFEKAPLILAECAITERVRRMPGVALHPSLFITPLIYDGAGAAILKKIYLSYRKIAVQNCLPILLCAPTWRLDRVRLQEAGFDDTLLLDAVRFMQEQQAIWQNQNSPLLLGALLGPRNDCYRPDQALSSSEAETFHSWQIERLATSGVDCLIAQTMPAVSEAQGMAQALSAAALPYIISFVINRHGKILDQTPLYQAITAIDESVDRPPLGYMVNCAYPTFIPAADQPTGFFDRLIGIQANSSALDHDDLDGATHLQREDISHWGGAMLHLHRRYGVRILGGCCGTDDSHLSYIAARC